MPNPKVGTVTPNVAEAVKNAKAGQVQFRADKAGIIHACLLCFFETRLEANLKALIEALNKAKPAAAKGVYLKKVALSSTMGIGARVDLSTSTNKFSSGAPESGALRLGLRYHGFWYCATALPMSKTAGSASFKSLKSADLNGQRNKISNVDGKTEESELRCTAGPCRRLLVPLSLEVSRS